MTQEKEINCINCQKESEIARINEQVKTLFTNYDNIGNTLDKIEDNQNKLIEDVSKITSIIDTAKWFIVVFITIFGGVFLFLISELIKIIH